MASMLERETRRERFLEIRLREVKLREKVSVVQPKGSFFTNFQKLSNLYTWFVQELSREKELERQQWEEDKAAEDDNVKLAEENFMKVIKAEIKKREGIYERLNIPY